MQSFQKLADELLKSKNILEIFTNVISRVPEFTNCFSV